MDASNNPSPHATPHDASAHNPSPFGLPPVRAPRTDAEVRAFLANLPRYRLWLHDDPHHAVADIARALADAVAMVEGEEAMRLCLLARKHGRAAIMLCYREQAEHYCERMRAHLLIASIEPE